MNKKEARAFMSQAERNGAKVINGTKHWKVFAADGRYLCSIPHGTGRGSAHSGDSAFKIARKEGWT
jgi:hypothetical protein